MKCLLNCSAFARSVVCYVFVPCRWQTSYINKPYANVCFASVYLAQTLYTRACHLRAVPFAFGVYLAHS